MNERVSFDRERWIDRDRRWAYACHRAASYRTMLALCRAVSRLGDGLVWYAIAAVLPVFTGQLGVQCAVHMVAAGAACLLVYKWLKKHAGRARPYVHCPDIQPRYRALDQFSFPSGHTLHAVSFTVVLSYYFPSLALTLVPFVLLVALSRMVLGLHYPSDVLGGALVGAAIALASIAPLKFF